jgi:hypothetical protein
MAQLKKLGERVPDYEVQAILERVLLGQYPRG